MNKTSAFPPQGLLKWGAPLALMLALLTSGCYTQLGAQATQADAPAVRTTASTPAQARVGLGGIAAEEYVAEYGSEEYAEYYDEDGYPVEYRQEQEHVTVTRYYADEYYDSRRAPIYVSHHYYYPRWRPYYFGPTWGGFHDPFYRPRSGFSLHIGFSFGSHWGYDPFWHGMAWYDPFWHPASWYHPFWHDPFLMWTMGFPVRPHWHYGGFYGHGWGFTHPSHAYWRGYDRGFAAGWHHGSFYGGSPWAGGYWSSGRSRGPVRSALNPDRTRERRSALAAVADGRRVAVDAPVGAREARALANDQRQVVLVNRRGSTLTDFAPQDRDERTRRMSDIDARQPRVGAPATDAPATRPAAEGTRSPRVTQPERTPRTQPEQPTREVEPQRDRPTREAQPQRPPRQVEPQRDRPVREVEPPREARPQRERPPQDAQPQRSRWDRPQPEPAPRETTRQAPPPETTRQAPPPQARPQPAPAPRETTRQAPPPESRPETREAPPPQTRQAPPPQTRPQPAPAPRETTRRAPPPQSETRDAPPPRDDQTPRSRPAPPAREDARQARPRPRSNAGSTREAPRPQARPAPQREQGSARPSSPRPASQARPARSSGDSGSARPSSRRNDGNSSRGTSRRDRD